MKQSTKSNPFKQWISNTFIPNRNDSKKKTTNKMILCIIAIVIIIALITGIIALVISAFNKPGDGNIVVDNPASDDSSVDETTSKDEEKEEPIDPENGVLAKFSEQFNKNNDFAGRISIPGTKLDLDVAKSRDHKYYYLDHTLDGKYDPYGTLAIDYRATLSPTYTSKNLTMYGHSNDDDGTYCAAVKEYKDLEFYKKHPILTFDTIYGNGTYKIIGRFTENVSVDNPKTFNYHDYFFFDEDEEACYKKYFDAFVDNVKKRSYFVAPVDVKMGDEFITISTCNIEIINSNTTPYRDVLVARKVRPGESAEVDVSKAIANKDMLMPDGWIAKFGKKNPYQ